MCDMYDESFQDNITFDLRDDESDNKPAGERWDPLGAPNEENSQDEHGEFYDEYNQSFPSMDLNRIKALEEEQEILTSSLLALTSHFAQVQFRLRQIVDAPPTERDSLLKNLEEFAFRGIPEINSLNHKLSSPNKQQNKLISENVATSSNILNAIETQRFRQYELIEQLKQQLSDLEKYAYENGDIVLPQSILIEKQNIIIDELKNKLNLNFDEIDFNNLSSDLIKNHVDTAIGDLVNPFKMKEQLVGQLKTQILDLERFISFLQDETSKFEFTENLRDDGDGKIDMDDDETRKKELKTFDDSRKNSGIINSEQIHEKNKKKDASNEEKFKRPVTCETSFQEHVPKIQKNEHLNNRAFSLISKASTLLQIFAVTQFGCGGGSHSTSSSSSTSTVSNNNSTDLPNKSNSFQRNVLKKTNKFNHWGDIRAQLEIDIQEIIALMQQIKLLFIKNKNDDDDSDESDGDNFHPDKNQVKLSEKYLTINFELTMLVRKNFAMTLKKLIQHGLYNDNETGSIVPFIGCFSSSSTNFYSKRRNYNANKTDHGNQQSTIDDEDDACYYNHQKITENLMHPWELILEYYHLKNGDKYNETPARKLSQSFNLDIVGSAAVSNKQILLSAIGSIIALHGPYKRSYNAHFKAFVCAGLNSQKLCQWLHLIFQCSELVSIYYTNWSYVACTDFRDALKSMERLNNYEFDLPVDLAIRQFQNIKDVFM